MRDMLVGLKDRVRDIVDYLVHDKPTSLGEIVSFVFIGSLSFTLMSSYTVAVSETEAASRGKPLELSPVFFLKTTFVSAPNPRPRVFTVSFHEGAVGASSDCDSVPQRFKSGLDLLPGSRDYLVTLADALLSCANASTPVKVEVRGFASSSEFRQCRDSAVWNRELANQRAISALTQLRQELTRLAGAASATAILEDSGRRLTIERPAPQLPGESQRLELTAHRWTETMDVGENVNDRTASRQYDRGRAALTRRADSIVSDFAGCMPIAVMDTPPSVRTAASVPDAAGPRSPLAE